ncbi:MAG: chemotaxis protein CheW [Cyanobacteria bacterium M_surface_10_m2_119]|nr:chemotaxis protein CheW [Cyanobacteria bacterium M_surface_10_m2_119]
MHDCWNQIGVGGDRSCATLNDVVHCHNCAVYSSAGRSLLERQPPADYLPGWTSVLADGSGAERVVTGQQALNLMVFRIGEEVLALPLELLQEVTPPSDIHSVPHRSNGTFLGLVNIRGEILLAASLRRLLDLPAASTPPAAGQRMAVTAAGEEQWVIAIDEVLGIHLCSPDDLEPPPVVHSAADALTQALFAWKDRRVALLDGPRLLNSLRRQVSQP